MTDGAFLGELLAREERVLLEEWVEEQQSAATLRPDLISDAELRQQSAEFLRALRQVIVDGPGEDVSAEEWTGAREVLERLSRERAKAGFTPAETATFVFSLKKPLFSLLQREGAADGASAEQLWQVTLLLDRLGLYTMEVYQRSREEIIRRQQMELLELSTPVVRLWEGIVGVPLIGTLDSERTQVVMEGLLQMIVDTGASIAIIDITGVPTVDTLVAQHLIKAVSAARLMGADCIISGIRPQIAQTIVHLGIDLAGINTRASLADALAFALPRLGFSVSRPAEA
jgi:rsbT co-antagonist protein RsbR